jgi:hypothetical protein
MINTHSNFWYSLSLFLILTIKIKVLMTILKIKQQYNSFSHRKLSLSSAITSNVETQTTWQGTEREKGKIII